MQQISLLGLIVILSACHGWNDGKQEKYIEACKEKYDYSGQTKENQRYIDNVCNCSLEKTIETMAYEEYLSGREAKAHMELHQECVEEHLPVKEDYIGWTEEQKQRTAEECKSEMLKIEGAEYSEEVINAYCDCSLEKVVNIYSYEGYLDEMRSKEVQRLFMECGAEYLK